MFWFMVKKKQKQLSAGILRLLDWGSPLSVEGTTDPLLGKGNWFPPGCYSWENFSVAAKVGELLSQRYINGVEKGH